MQIEVKQMTDITCAERERWIEIQQSHADLHSPFFAPEFAEAVAEARGDLQLAVIRENGREKGFLPFHRNSSGAGTPVGTPLNDFQGLIIEASSKWRPADLLRTCGLRRLEFDHLLASQSFLQPYHAVTISSPQIALPAGFDEFRRHRRAAGSQLVEQLLRKERKFAREQGPLRFELRSADDTAFHALLSWKSEQCQRTGIRDVLRYAWVVELLDRLRDTSTDSFAGMVSTLHVGDDLAAVHLGMRYRRVLHWWFPTYNRRYHHYSPGLILLLRLARLTGPERLERIELGKGDERYKHSLTTGGTLIAEGMVARRKLSTSLCKVVRVARNWVRASPLRGPARIPKRFARRVEYWFACKQKPES